MLIVEIGPKIVDNSVSQVLVVPSLIRETLAVSYIGRQTVNKLLIRYKENIFY